MKVIAIALSAAVLCAPAYAQWFPPCLNGYATCSASPVGISTTNPTTNLQAVGTLNGGGIISWLGGVNAFVGTSNSSVFGATGTAYLASTAQLAFSAGQGGGVTADPSSSAILIDNNGNVGIGTTSPGVRFDVVGTAAVYEGARRVARFFDNSAMAQGVGGGVDFLGKYNSGGAYTQYASLKGVKLTPTDGDFQGQFVISIDDLNGNMQEIVHVKPTGMDVTGEITGTNIHANYQDVAEWVPAAEALAPGTVVVLDRRAANHVMASRHAYDTSVAGVVSKQPGVILGEAGKDKAQIATTGRVRVKVDATKGAVDIGDLLVTSDRAGYAMKSQPVEISGRSFHQPGTVLGKALEPLPNGEGEILVLLSLQ